MPPSPHDKPGNPFIPHEVVSGRLRLRLAGQTGCTSRARVAGWAGDGVSGLAFRHLHECKTCCSPRGAEILGRGAVSDVSVS